MARSPFTIIERKNTAGKRVYMARFVDSEGTYSRSITLPEAKSRTQAVRMAENILKENEKALIPRGTKSNPNAVEYCLDFWKEDSAYSEEKRLGGHPLSLHYIEESRRLVKNYLSSYLEGKPLLSVTPGDVKEIRRDLARKGYNTRRINCIMQAFRVPHAVFCEDRAIVNPLIVVKKLPENLKKRGILTVEELKAVMTIKDEDPRVMAAILLGCLCGLRLGECRGLKWESVDTENMTIAVKDNYISEKEGSKGCKWGSNRTVPLPSPVLETLNLCKAVSRGGDFVLWNDRRPGEVPACAATVQAGFRRVLKHIGISEKEREARNITFHSCRHVFVTLTRASGLNDYLTMQLSGHKSSSMMENYSENGGAVIDFKAAREALEAQLKQVSGEAKR